MTELTSKQIITLLNQKVLTKSNDKEVVKASELGLTAEENMYLVVYGSSPLAIWKYLNKLDSEFKAIGNLGKIWTSPDFLIKVKNHD